MGHLEAGALLSLPVVFGGCYIAQGTFRVAGAKAQGLNGLILVLIPSYRTASSAGNPVLRVKGGMELLGQPWGCFGFYTEDKTLFLPQAAQPGAAEIFVSAPITAFPIAGPPTETGSATSQALHRWKAQL